MRVSFTNASGLEVYAVRLHVAGGPPWPSRLPLAGRRSWRDLSDSQSIGVETLRFNLRIDRQTGRVTIANGDSFKAVGPTLNMGELRYDDGDFLNRNDVPWIGSKVPPILSNVNVAGGWSGGADWHAIVSADAARAESPGHVLARLTYELTVIRSLTPTGLTT